MNEPFYLFMGIIAVFAAGLVAFFTTRKEEGDEDRHSTSHKRKHIHRAA